MKETCPIWVRHGTVAAGQSCNTPESHPCCEFNLQLSGAGVELVGSETMARGAGSLFLAGPGVPHWIELTSYPVAYVTIFFLPSLLIDMGPESDGMRILRRFTAVEGISRRIIATSGSRRDYFVRGFESVVQEWEGQQFGREVRLRTLLLEMLVELMRWEGPDISAGADRHDRETEWKAVQRALEYMRSHYTEALYTEDVAEAAGVSKSRLQSLFRNGLGMSWGKYLQAYRIHQAAGLLSNPGCGVLEAALAVGFDTLSHFNATFRSVMGKSPRDFRKDRSGDESM